MKKELEEGWLVCGSRELGLCYDPKTGVTRPQAQDEFDWMIWALDWHYQNRPTPDGLINGGMIGADAIASYWAYRKNVDTYCIGAKWSNGAVAGPRRNRVMLFNYKPLLVIGFLAKPLEESRGTANMLTTARKSDVETIYYTYPNTEETIL